MHAASEKLNYNQIYKNTVKPMYSDHQKKRLLCIGGRYSEVHNSFFLIKKNMPIFDVKAKNENIKKIVLIKNNLIRVLMIS